MSMPIDGSKKWSFFSHEELDPNGLPCLIKKVNNKLCLNVLSDLKIELNGYDEKNGTVSGHYSIESLGVSGEITFRKNPDFFNLIGNPQGFHGLPDWKLVAYK